MRSTPSRDGCRFRRLLLPLLLSLFTSFVMARPAYCQDLEAIENRSLEVRNLQPLACGTLPNATQYLPMLQAAVKELKDNLSKLQQMAPKSSILGDSSASISKSVAPLVQALADPDACKAATAFAAIKPERAAKVPVAPPTDILVSPQSIIFDDLEIGDQSSPVSFSITNQGQNPIAINDVEISHCNLAGTDCRGTSAEFAFAKAPSQPCPNLLDKSNHCDVQLIFKPGWAGNFRAQATVKITDSSGNPRTEVVVLQASAHVANLASLNGDGSGSNNPSMRSVLGFDISGASSAANQQKAFVEFDLNTPLGPAGKVCVPNVRHQHYRPSETCKLRSDKGENPKGGDAKSTDGHYETRRDPLNRRLWAFFNPRITSLPQPRSAISDLNVQGFTDFLNGKTTDLVQGLDIQGGLEYLIVKPRTGIPFFSSYKNMHGRLGVALVGGVGFTTPFATPGTNPTVFTLPTGSPLRTQFNVPDMVNGTAITNIAFVDKARSRFFRKYFAGIRLKTYQFSDLAKGICDPDFDRKCEALDNLFPGIIDLTVGQDEQVTGGHLSRWVFRLDAVYPLPFAPSFNIFGSLNTVFQKNISTAPLILPPTSSAALSDPSVFIVNVDPQSRDIYRIGLGVNLLELLKKKPSPGSNVQTPPDANTLPASKPAPAPTGGGG